MAPVNGAATKLSPANRRIRSAVTNGTHAYVEGDGNKPVARRQRDLVALLADGAGGAETISAANDGAEGTPTTLPPAALEEIEAVSDELTEEEEGAPKPTTLGVLLDAVPLGFRRITGSFACQLAN